MSAWDDLMNLANNSVSALGGVGNNVLNNPIGKFLLGAAGNTFRDIGTAAGTDPATQQSQNATLDMIPRVMDKANTTLDPEERKRLIATAQQAAKTVGQGAQQQAAAYSPDVQQNPILRGANTGMQIASSGDMLAHPVSTITAPLKMLAHPLKTIQGGIDAATGVLENPVGAINSILHDPASFHLDQANDPLTKLGNKFLLQQYGKGAKAVQAPIESIGQLADWGITTPDKVSQAADVVTGSDGIVNRMVKKAVISSGPIDTTGILDNAQSVLDDLETIPQHAKDQVFKNVTSAIKKATVHGSGVVGEGTDIAQGIAGGDPEKLFDTLHTWEGKAYRFKGDPSSDAGQVAQAYKNLAADLRDRLFTKSGADSRVISGLLSTEDYQKLAQISPKFASDVTNAKTVADLRSLQAPFVQGSQMAGVAERTASMAPNIPQMMGVAASAATGNALPALATASTLSPVQNAVGSSLRKAGSLIGSSGGQIGADIAGQTFSHSPQIQGDLPLGQERNNHNNNDNNQKNLNQGLPPTPSITPGATASQNQPVTIPKSINDIKPDASGNIPAPVMPENIQDTDGSPLVIGDPQARAQEKVLSDAAIQADTQAKMTGTAQDINAAGMAKNALTQFQQKAAASKELAGLGEKANSTYNAINGVIGQIQNTDVNLLQNIGSIDKLYSTTDPKYAALKTAIQQLAIYHPNDIKTIWESHNPTAMINQLKELQRYDQDIYYGNIRSSLGISNQGSSEVPTTSTVPTANSYKQSTLPINPPATIPKLDRSKPATPITVPGTGGGLSKKPTRIPQKYEYR